jgi:hypothetical protein
MDAPRQVLLEALVGHATELAEAMVDRTRVEIPSFEAVPRADHLADTTSFTVWLARFSLGAAVPDLDGDQLVELGRRRAEQGIPVEDLLRAWRISVEIGTDRAREMAAELDLDPQLVIDLFQGALRAADEALVPLAIGHRRGRPLTDVDAGRGRELFVLATLTGELPADEVHARAASFGLDPTTAYRALRAVGPDSPEVPPELPAGRFAETETPDPLCTLHEG